MTIYRRKYSQPLKWLVALILFVLVMGVTFTDVYGMGKDRGNRPGNHRNHGDNPGCYHGDSTSSNNDNPPPTAVPEPSTFILLAGGLGTLYAARRLRNEK